MKVLVLDEEIPYPLNTGKRIRVHALLTRMAKRHDLTLITYVTPGVDDLGISEMRDAGIRVVAVRPVRREQRGWMFYGKLLANLFSPLPYISWNYYSHRMRRQLRKLLITRHFDLIHAEMTLLAPLLQGIRAVPTVGIAHNVETDIWRRYVETEASWTRRRYIELQARRVDWFERSALSFYNVVCPVSDRDASWFQKFTGINRIHVVQNGVDLNYFSPLDTSEDSFTLVHAGTMDWRPNVDGVSHFLKETYPRILQQIPQARFLIVGRNPDASLRHLAAGYPGAEVTGTVDDVRPFIACGAVFVVPLRVGGGTRGKILIALAMGKAVVSTSVGAEGLDVVDGQHLVLGDDPQDFADRTVELLKDEIKRRRLGANGRSLVETLYGWDTVADRLELAWRDAVEGFRCTT